MDSPAIVEGVLIQRVYFFIFLRSVLVALSTSFICVSSWFAGGRVRLVGDLQLVGLASFWVLDVILVMGIYVSHGLGIG